MEAGTFETGGHSGRGRELGKCVDACDEARDDALDAGESGCGADRDDGVSEGGSALCDCLVEEEGKSWEGRVEGFGVPAAPVKLAVGIGSRMKGLLMTRPDGDSLLLAPCNDVHTVGMRHPLDIAFVDQTGLVLEVFRDVGPRRRLRNRKAVAVVERFSACGGPWIEPGERLGVIGLKGSKL